MASIGRSTQTSSTFRTQCDVSIDIHSTPERIWQLLTDAQAFPRWNSTVTRVSGPIAPGAKLELEVPAAPGRTFKPKVAAFEPCRRMTWSEGLAPMFKGVRPFTLTPTDAQSTRFTMNEVLAGLMLPMIKGSLPDFGPVFETYASDLKREAERSRT
jgi:hypothetical protein